MHSNPTKTCVRCGAPVSKPTVSLCRKCFRVQAVPPNPSGLCMCGCGGITPIAKRGHTKGGTVAGEHVKYIRGHTRKSAHPEYIVNPDTGCWEWQRHINMHGYGQGYDPAGTSKLAHRLMYERHVGPVPDGLELDHLCRNRRCVNPAQLQGGPGYENQRRAPRTKLGIEQARTIRRLYATGRHSHRSLAAQFGVSHQTIASVIANRKWRDYDSPG